jgi:hypothetical protein
MTASSIGTASVVNQVWSSSFLEVGLDACITVIRALSVMKLPVLASRMMSDGIPYCHVALKYSEWYTRQIYEMK